MACSRMMSDPSGQRERERERVCVCLALFVFNSLLWSLPSFGEQQSASPTTATDAAASTQLRAASAIRCAPRLETAAL